MHKRLTPKGLAVITVAVDELSDKGAKEKAERFLVKQDARFTNLLLDEPPEFWQKKFGFLGVPCQFVFDRQGRWTRFTSDEAALDHKAVEKLIEQLLSEK